MSTLALILAILFGFVNGHNGDAQHSNVSTLQQHAQPDDSLGEQPGG